MKDAYYFTHDYGARNDPKLQNVLMELGLAGIGAYWNIVEMIYEQGGILPLYSCKSIAFQFHTDIDLINRLIFDFDLFKNDGEVFWSESINSRLKKRAEISEKRRVAGKIGWQKTFGNYQTNEEQLNIKNINTQRINNNTLTNIQQMPENLSANAEQTGSICPAIKGKEIKENKIEKEIKLDLKEEEIKEEEMPKLKKPSKAQTDKRFVPPSLEEVEKYVLEKNYKNVDAQNFINYYESVGWFVGKKKMVNWRAAVANWETRNKNNSPPPQKRKPANDNYDVNEIWKEQIEQAALKRKYQEA